MRSDTWNILYMIISLDLAILSYATTCNNFIMTAFENYSSTSYYSLLKVLGLSLHV